GMPLAHHAQRFLAVGGGAHLVVGGGQVRFQQLGALRVVVGDQDAGGHGGSSGPGLSYGLRVRSEEWGVRSKNRRFSFSSLLTPHSLLLTAQGGATSNCTRTAQFL